MKDFTQVQLALMGKVVSNSSKVWCHSNYCQWSKTLNSCSQEIFYFLSIHYWHQKYWTVLQLQTKAVLSTLKTDLIDKSAEIYFFLLVLSPLFCLMIAICEQFNKCLNTAIFIISSEEIESNISIDIIWGWRSAHSEMSLLWVLPDYW